MARSGSSVTAATRRPLAELRSIAAEAAAGWRAGRRPWLAVGLAAGTCLCDLLLGLPATAGWVASMTDVRASLPLDEELARLPLSALVPTADLPNWLAVGQLLVVVGLAELLFDRRIVVALAVVGHLLPTLAVRAMVQLGPDNLLALPHALAAELDTGPSALTTALGGFLLTACGGRRAAALLAAGLLVADRYSPGVDGREHLLALLVGLLAGVAYVVQPRCQGLPTILAGYQVSRRRTVEPLR